MKRRSRRSRRRGVVAVEFIVAIIPFILMMTGVVQLALISVAKIATHYAAACAARAAIVVVPEEEEHGTIAGNGRIKDAALYALLPVASPSGNANMSIGNALARGTAWGNLAKKVGVLLQQSRLGSDEFDAQITTRVVYAYHCTVPMASRFFCGLISDLPPAAKRDLERAKIDVGSGRYLILRAEHTLTKQGRPNPDANPLREPL
jgi:Flp pilus assembly protein TadG